MAKAKGETKGLGLVMPTGLYTRVTKLAEKSRMSVHAYIVHILWRETGWKPDKPTSTQNTSTPNGVSDE